MSLGEIKFFPYQFVPHGWLPCIGQELPINQNTALFALIASMFGHGTLDFSLPDLRDRAILDASRDYPEGKSSGDSTLPITGQEESNLQPYLSLNYIINLETEDNSYANPFLGEIRLFACSADKAPEGWVPCDGRLLPINQYSALYSLIGTTYGSDGLTFALPDLCGRAPIGTDPHKYQLDQKGGEESVTLGASGSATNMQPFLALRPAIQVLEHMAIRGTSLSGGYLGEVQFYPSDHIPFEWAKCDGQMLSVTDYPELFDTIGTTYGGNGNPVFQLPDLSGRVVIGAGNGPGLTSRTLAEVGGETAVETIPNTTINNMQPFMAMNFMINIERGAYPRRLS